jgi:uncharacterized membrane protein (UPF0127 family)
MKLIIFSLGGLVIILVLFFVIQQSNLDNSPMPQNNPLTEPEITLPILTAPQFTTPISIGAAKLEVAVANTNESRQQGLSGQPGLKENQGMLFDFKNSERSKPGFWMKDMLFDLDMIWIRDNTVVDITRNVPAPDPRTPLKELPLYFPAEPIDTIVEVLAGWSDKNGVTVGTKLSGY